MRMTEDEHRNKVYEILEKMGWKIDFERIERALDWKAGDIEQAQSDYGMAPYVIAGLRMLALEPGLLERMEEA